MSFDPNRYLNQRVAAVPKSGIRKFFDVAATIPGAISLGVGEPDFVTPYHIRNAAINSILDGETQYTSNWGLLELRQEIAAYVENRFHISYDPKNEILVTVGASEGIDLALRALLNPGDEVLVPEPSYVSYAPCVIFAGGTPVAVPTSEANNFVLTPEALEKAVTAKTKALILPYPNNPTGGILGRPELEKLREVILRHDLIVISDEIYAELTYNGQGHVSIASLPDMKERTIYLNGFSKAYAMTGWRMGYLCAPAAFTDVMCKIHQYSIMCAPRQGQVAAVEALRKAREDGCRDVVEMRQSYDRRRRLMVQAFRDMGLSCFEPLGAFYVFPGIQKNGLTSEEVLARRIGADRLIYCMSRLNARKCGSHVEFQPVGDICIGERDGSVTDRIQEIHDLLDGMVSCRISREILLDIWRKYMFNAAFNTEESILRCRHRWFQQLPETGAALECIMEEIVQLANACGVALSEADIRALDGYFDPYPGDGLCSMAQDLQAGRPTEIDMLIGEALELGRSRSVELPVCRFVYHLVKAMEQANACGLETW